MFKATQLRLHHVLSIVLMLQVLFAGSVFGNNVAEGDWSSISTTAAGDVVIQPAHSNGAVVVPRLEVGNSSISSPALAHISVNSSTGDLHITTGTANRVLINGEDVVGELQRLRAASTGSAALFAVGGRIATSGTTSGVITSRGFRMDIPNTPDVQFQGWLPVASVTPSFYAGMLSEGTGGRLLLGTYARSDSNGHGSNYAMTYDPTRDGWYSYPEAPFPAAGRRFASSVTADGMLFVIGGFRNGDGARLGEVWRFKPLQRAWQPMPNLPVALLSTMAVTCNGSIFVLGGTSASGPVSTVYSLDPNSNSSGAWVTTWPPLQIARASGAAVVTSNGTIVVLGGSIAGAAGSCTDAIEMFHPDTDVAWRVLLTTTLSSKRYALGYVRYSGFIYLLGGVGDAGNLLPTVERLDETTMTTEPLPDYPIAVRDSALASIGIQ